MDCCCTHQPATDDDILAHRRRKTNMDFQVDIPIRILWSDVSRTHQWLHFSLFTKTMKEKKERVGANPSTCSNAIEEVYGNDGSVCSGTIVNNDDDDWPPKGVATAGRKERRRKTAIYNPDRLKI